MISKHNILITSAGRRVELVKSFQTELNKYFVNAEVYATDSHPELSAACQCADISFPVPRVTDKDYMEELLLLCKRNNIGMVLPTIDTELKLLAD